MIQELVKKLQGETIPYLTMYFVFKGDGTPIIRLVDLDESIKNDFAFRFRSFLSENFSKEDLVTGNISSADERKYNALLFDIDLISP